MSEIPQGWQDWLTSRRTGKKRTETVQNLPAYVKARGGGMVERALGNLREATAAIEDVVAALEVIPNPDIGWDAWNRVLMAIWAATEGSEAGLAAAVAWSAKSRKHDGEAVRERWAHYSRSPPTEIGFGALVWAAREAVPGWEMPSRRPRPAAGAAAKGMNGHAHAQNIFGPPSDDNPLIELNKKYAMIADVGGKSRVMSWKESAIDARCQEPLFQDSRSFAEFYANQYITVTKTKHLKAGPEEYEDDVQLGQWWLKWTGRRSYAGVELAPNEPEVLPNGNYNLWRGWGVTPAEGKWPRMREHIEEILAAGDSEAVKYIINWTAWGVQHPGDLAGAALALKGDKGAGKSVFFRSVRQMYGSHGLHITNRSHLVGNFNAHHQNCLFMFADEAFWAGDVKGESILKGLITEPTSLIERKGVDAVMWPNRMKIGLSANAEWVVPATEGERRFGVFNVASDRARSEPYFTKLYAELRDGGIGAMLYELLNTELGDWTPRLIPQNSALQQQKKLGMSALYEWWLGLLQGHGEGWMEFDKPSDKWGATELMNAVRASAPGLSRVSNYKIAEFLGENGAIRFRPETGSKWQLPCAREARARFEAKFGAWKWEKWKGAEK